MNIPIIFNNAPAAPVNGYGRITIAPGGTQDISVIALYAVDPSLNILDPNDTTTSHGPGALLTDLDQKVNGSGVLLTQQVATGPAQGNFALNGHIITAANGEADFVGQAAANAGSLSGNVDVNDFASGTGQNPAVAFSGTLTADTAHGGRFTIPVNLKLANNQLPLNLVFYQVSDSQFVMVEAGTGTSGTGTMQKQQ